ncbi:multifunctional CCA addition/repair protein [Elongatibacter sediminis]|uniref:Multifunctional CCA protein n=1 Tax=Elongatibacter sediminis TaxID=3119006 RepID=A0AAW9RBL1_9GAMM
MTTATYLVGGAVRDDLLGLPVHERDWVVTGATPDDLLDQGYRQVGASFPVFLHPETGEEYALARTERKQGHGYHGFAVDFHPGVTLEQDLERRDLTVNAMARDEEGRLIDPFGGRADLEARVLRHVSPAFVEDPLRVLRVARFAARFAGLGFQVHPNTLALMREITESGELQHLAAERCWNEITGGLAAATPGRFVEVLREAGALAVLLPEVDVLFGVPQPERWHPEIDTGRHVLMALNAAADLQAPVESRFAVLVHDLGKGLTPRETWPSHPGHDEAGVALVRAVCERLRAPVAFRRLAEAVCALHLRCHKAREMRPGKLLNLLERADLLRRPESLEPFLLACEADYRGRLGLEQRSYPQGDTVRRALEAAQAVRAGDLELEGLHGPQIGELLRQARIEAVAMAVAGAEGSS